MLDYTFNPYPGKVTLFRSDVQLYSLLLPSDMGWSPYVKALEIIPYNTPTHHSVQGMGAKSLANKLKKCLEEIGSG